MSAETRHTTAFPEVTPERVAFIRENAEVLLADRDGLVKRQRARITQLERTIWSLKRDYSIGPKPSLRKVVTSARRFVILRHQDVSGISGTGIVADGLELPSGRAVVGWRGDHPSVAVYAHLSDVEAVHCHAGASTIIMLDDWPSAEDYQDEMQQALDDYLAQRQACPYCGELFHSLANHVRPMHREKWAEFKTARNGEPSP